MLQFKGTNIVLKNFSSKKLLMVLCFLSMPISAEENAKDYSILHEIPEILKMFKQCSRMTPSFRTSYSKLEPELVEKVEAMLPAALQKFAPNKDINLDDYYRQYISFGMLRRELVYVNAVHKDAAKKWVGNDASRQALLNNWKTKTINICGGKDLHWGAIYDGSGDVISEILFNTSAKK